jgi:Flp pilus assembly protein TadD
LLPWLLLALGAVAYANSLTAGFVFDDGVHIVRNPSLHTLWPVSDHLRTQRGLVQLTLAMNYAIEAREPRGYHLVNVVIHLLAGLTLYGLVRRTLLTARMRARYEASAPWLAAIIAGLWIVHPLQTESVTYIIQRAEAMGGLFFFLMMYSMLRHHDSASWRGRAFWAGGVLASLVLGVMSKESVAVAPLVVALHDRCFLSPGWEAMLRQRRWFYGLLLAGLILSAGMIVRLLEHATSAGFNVESLTPTMYLFTQPAVIVQYLRLVFWPDALVLDYLWPAALHAHEHVPHTMLLAALGVLSAWGVVRNQPAGFLGAWFFIALAPTSSFVPILDLYFEHRMYVPLAPVLALVVLAVDAWLRRLPSPTGRLALGGALAALVLAGMAARTIQRNFDYRNELTTWASVLEHRPENPRAQVNYGAALNDVAKRPLDALNHYRMAARLNPGYPDAYTNIGSVYLNLGRLDEAQAAYAIAYRMDARNPSLVRNLGKLGYKRGDLAAAERYFREALQLDPRNGATYDDLGLVLMQTQRLEEAQDALLQAVSLAPQHVYGWINLAELRLKQGRLDEAAATARRARALVEPDPSLINSLGSILARAGQYDEAIAQFTQAIALAPAMTSAYGNLAGALLKQGRPAEALLTYREALTRGGNDPALVRRVAWLLATHPDEKIRNASEALQMATWANEQAGGKSALYLQTLAAALANAGRYDEATKVQQAALRAAGEVAGAQEQTLAEYRAQLASYQQGQPLRAAP